VLGLGVGALPPPPKPPTPNPQSPIPILRNNNLIFYKNIYNNKKYFTKLKIFIKITPKHIKKLILIIKLFYHLYKIYY
jgi:hypothetical protein